MEDDRQQQSTVHVCGVCVCDRFELELEHERKRERHVLWYRSSVSRRS